MDWNAVRLSGTVAQLQPLRYTPAGIPLLQFTLAHASEQMEAGVKRQTELEIEAMAVDRQALAAARLKAGDHVEVRGFLARKSRNSTHVVLHVNELELR